LHQLLEHRAAIEHDLGDSLIWNPNPDASDKVIRLQRKADIRIKDQWPEYLNWMVDAVIRLRKVFGPRIKALQLDAIGTDPSAVNVEDSIVTTDEVGPPTGLHPRVERV